MSVNTPSSQDGGRGTHATHFVQLYPQPLYTASQVRTTCRSWDEGVLTDLCLTGVLTDLCLTGVLTDLCLTLYSQFMMHGKKNIKLTAYA